MVPFQKDNDGFDLLLSSLITTMGNGKEILEQKTQSNDCRHTNGLDRSRRLEFTRVSIWGWEVVPSMFCASLQSSARNCIEVLVRAETFRI